MKVQKPSKQKTVKNNASERSGKNSDFLRNLFFPAIIFLYAFFLYSNTLLHEFVMDDGAVVTDNITVQKGFAGVGELFHQSSVYGSTKENFGNYRPLTMTLFAIEKQFFGNNASRFHLVHVFLYALCSTIVFITLRKLFTNYHPLLSFIAGLLFVTHPIHTEVGANIKSVDEILSLMFCSMSLYFAIQYLSGLTPSPSPKERGANAILSWVCFLAALFSKENSITFLFVIPIALLLFTSPSKKHLGGLCSLYCISVLFYLLVRGSVLEKTPESMSIINNSLAGALSLNEKFGTIFYILLFYFRLLLFPHPLSWDYSFNQIPIVSFANISSIISVLLYLSIGVYALTILFRNFKSKGSISRHPTSLIFAFSILFYLITLSLSSNVFVLIAATMAERFLFIPSLAFCLVIAVLLLKLSKYEIAGIKNGNRLILAILLMPILLLYSFGTWTRSKDWKSNYTLFASGVATSPNSYRTHSSFAWESLKVGQKDTKSENGKRCLSDAVTHYQKAVAIYGMDPNDWYNLGVANYNLERIDEAMKAYQQAVLLRPNHRNASFNLASIYLAKNDYANSLKYFQRAYETDSSLIDALFKIGVNYHMIGDTKNAIITFEKFLKFNPNSKDAISNLAVEYRMVGDNQKADYYTKRLNQTR